MEEETREGWLVEAVAELKAGALARACIELPRPVKVAMGWPKGARGGAALGQCWASDQCEDGSNQVFISPRLTDPEEVLTVLAHELIHAADDCQSGHKGPFRDMAGRLGFLPPFAAVDMSNRDANLREEVAQLAAILGPIPNAAMKERTRGSVGSRQKKAECLSCGWLCRGSRARLDELPSPAICPRCETRALVAVE